MRSPVLRSLLLPLLSVVVGAGCTESAGAPAEADDVPRVTVTVPPNTPGAAGGTTAPPVTPPPPGEPTGPQPVSVTVPPTSEEPKPDPAIDYEAVASVEGTVDTPLGSIKWLKTSVVPSEWLYGGFPTPSFVADPFSYDRSWQRVADAAPCCLAVTRTDGGWLGVGRTDRSTACGPGAEVWLSEDGTTWSLLSDEGFGEAGPCQISRVVEFGGSAAAIGVGETDGRRVGAVWVTHNLRTWLRTDVRFEKPGMDTYVSSVIASPNGWAMFGMRVAHEPTAKSETGIRLGHFPFEWAGWISTDGVTWSPLNMARMFGQPWCKPNHRAPCGRIEAMVTADGIVAYVHQATDSTVPDMRDGWALWIGLFED